MNNLPTKEDNIQKDEDASKSAEADTISSSSSCTIIEDDRSSSSSCIIIEDDRSSSSSCIIIEDDRPIPDNLVNTLQELQEQVAEYISSDNDFSLLAEKVRRNHALRSMDSIRKLLFGEENVDSSIGLEDCTNDQKSIDVFLEATGFGNTIKDTKVKFDEMVSNTEKLLKSLVSDNEKLMKVKKNLIVEMKQAEVKSKFLFGRYKDMESELAFHTKAADKMYFELKRLSQKYSSTADIVNSFADCEKYLHDKK